MKYQAIPPADAIAAFDALNDFCTIGIFAYIAASKEPIDYYELFSVDATPEGDLLDSLVDLTEIGLIRAIHEEES